MAGYENRDVWVAVPAFNEARAVARTIGDLRALGVNVVVVDDGSTDTTAAEAGAAGAWVVRHVINLGQGAALQTGIEFTLSKGAAYIATFDADGQHHAHDLARMFDVLRSGRADIVLGSRFLGRTENMPLGRRLLLRGMVALTRFFSRVDVTDVHNGLRAMTADTARRLHLTQDEMAHASELLTQIRRLDLRFEEVPVTITYTRYSLEKGQKLSTACGF